MDIVEGRRSVRKYEDREVPAEALTTILEAVRWASFWAITQCRELVVVRDRVIKEMLQSVLPARGNPACAAMVQAPVGVAL